MTQRLSGAITRPTGCGHDAPRGGLALADSGAFAALMHAAVPRGGKQGDDVSDRTDDDAPMVGWQAGCLPSLPMPASRSTKDSACHSTPQAGREEPGRSSAPGAPMHLLPVQAPTAGQRSAATGTAAASAIPMLAGMVLSVTQELRLKLLNGRLGGCLYIDACLRDGVVDITVRVPGAPDGRTLGLAVANALDARIANRITVIYDE
jgi:hypothetical protein